MLSVDSFYKPKHHKQDVRRLELGGGLDNTAEKVLARLFF